MAGGGARRIPYNAMLLLLCLAMSFIVFSDAAQVRGSSIRSLNHVQAHGPGKLRLSDCRPKCVYRCSATSHKKPCMFFCQKCCATCLCVPPGTYGNKEQCPCYNNWKTQQGSPKCP